MTRDTLKELISDPDKVWSREELFHDLEEQLNSGIYCRSSSLKVAESESNKAVLKYKLPQPGHLKRLEENRKYTSVVYENMIFKASDIQNHCARTLRKETVDKLLTCIQNRFAFFSVRGAQDHVFEHMWLMDPATWSKPSDNTYTEQFAKECNSLTALAHMFDVTAKSKNERLMS